MQCISHLRVGTSVSMHCCNTHCTGPSAGAAPARRTASSMQHAWVLTSAVLSDLGCPFPQSWGLPEPSRIQQQRVSVNLDDSQVCSRFARRSSPQPVWGNLAIKVESACESLILGFRFPSMLRNRFSGGTRTGRTLERPPGVFSPGAGKEVAQRMLLHWVVGCSRAGCHCWGHWDQLRAALCLQICATTVP